MTTVWIYVDTNKEVGDVDHLKVFATPELAELPAAEDYQSTSALMIDLLRASIRRRHNRLH
jgi:hypothetical protein